MTMGIVWKRLRVMKSLVLGLNSISWTLSVRLGMVSGLDLSCLLVYLFS